MTSHFSTGDAPGALRDAASVVLVRDGAGGPEVLMVRRKKGSSFMADAFVFPGGRVDAADGAPGEERTLVAAGIRELFEEAGVLLAVDADGKLVATDGDDWFRAARDAVHARQRSFADVLAARRLALADGELAAFARWITPATEARRFDARFYLARMPPGQTSLHNAEELVEQRWATPRAILDDYARGGLKLPPPTLWHLTGLARHATVEAAVAWARGRTSRFAPVRPKLVEIDGALAIVLPWDAEYARFPGESDPAFADGRAHPDAGDVTRYLLLDGRWTPRSV